MSDVLTPNYGLTKPDVGGSDDTWGDKLNGNFDILDNSLKSVSNAIPAPVAPATAIPLVESGVGAVGASNKYAREDHVHPVNPGAGSGDVTGPASAVADRIAVFNGTTGKVIKDGGKTIAEVLASGGGGGIDQATADARYVNVTGDTMTGSLRGGNIFLGTGVEAITPLPAKVEVIHETQPSAFVVGQAAGNMQLLYYPDAVTPANGMARFATTGWANGMSFDASTIYFQALSLKPTHVGGKLIIDDTTVSSSPTTGALTVAGGVGIAGELNVTGNVHARDVYAARGAIDGVVWLGLDGTTYIYNTGAALQLNGKPVAVTSAVASTSPTTGALTVAGGLGVNGAINTPTPPAGDNSTKAATTAFVASSVLGRNRLINGGFSVDQRYGGGVAIGGVDNAYTGDMWRAMISAGLVTYYMRDNGFPNPYDGAIQIGTANTKAGLFQVIEGINCKDLSSKNVVLSGKISTSTITNVRFGILEWTGTEDATQADPVSAWNAAGTNPTLNANWVFRNTPVSLNVTPGQMLRYSVTTTLGGTFKNLAVLIWCDGGNTASEVMYLQEFQLEEGTTPTAFDRRSYAHELMLCQRYAWTWRPSLPGVVAGGHISNGGAYVANNMFFTMQHPVTMRIAPTGIVRSADATWAILVAGGGGPSVPFVFNAATPFSISFTTAATAAAGFFGSLYSSGAAAVLSVTGAEL